MIRVRLRGWAEKVAAEVRRSFSEEYTPRQIAGSFAIGVFITMMPTLGTGLLVFFVIAYLFDWINKIALFASVVVLNPVVKWGVYAASLTLGFLLLGPIEGVTTGTVSVDDGRDVLIRLLLGNTILAIIATIIAYVLVLRFARTYQERAGKVVDVVLTEMDLDADLD